MESHSCEKTGEGVPPSASDQCSFIDSKGARCRMFGGKDSALCPHHARKQLAAHRKGKALVAKSLLRYVPDFSLAVSVNTFIGNVVRQYVLGNLDRKDAIALGYLAQIAATTLPAVDRQYAEERKVLTAMDREQNIRESVAPRESTPPDHVHRN